MTSLNRYHKDGTLPENGEVFVFGSNMSGIHGAGAARVAREKFDMEMGIWFGWARNMRSFAIPTKDKYVEYSLPLQTIYKHVEMFVAHTNMEEFEDKQFFVTRVGCGLAGYSDSQIAPMFKGAKNCSFAETWKPYLEINNGI